jgi:glycosyltransferase involved in cell wall biosynthesis
MRLIWYYIEKAGLHHARNVGVVCRSAGERLAKQFHLGTPYVIHNVPPGADYAQVVADAELRTRRRIPQDHRVAIFKGDIATSRGLVPFVRAMRKVKNVHLVVLGDGPFHGELAGLAADLQVTDRVHFMGRVHAERFPSLLAAADLGHVMHENVGSNLPLTLPSKLFDYMHAGLPILSGNQGEMAAIVRKNDIGWSIDPGDQDTVDTAVTQFAEADRSVLRSMGRRSAAAAQSYCWEQERVAYLDYVKNALGR